VREDDFGEDVSERGFGQLLRSGIECKFADAPRITPSIRNGLADLGLAKVAILYPGNRRFPLSDQVEAVPVSSLATGAPVFAPA